MPTFRAPRPLLAGVAALLVAAPAAALAADYPNYPSYPTTPTTDYPNYPTTPTTPTTCPTGQVGTPPNCQTVVLPDPEPETPTPTPTPLPTPTPSPSPKPEDPKPETPGPVVPAQQPAPSPPAKPAPAAAKPKLAFKGKVKATKKGEFSVACTATGIPKGAACRLRVIVGPGKEIAKVTVPVTGDAARLRIKLSKKQRKLVPRSRKVRVALDLLDAKGVVLSTTRQSVTLPKK